MHRYGHRNADCRQKQLDNQNKPQNDRGPNKSFYQNKKNDQNLPNKNIHCKNSSGNHSQILIITIDNNHLTEILIAEDLQIKAIHKAIHNIDIVDLIVKITNIETNTQYQIQTEVIRQIMIGTVTIQTLGIDIIQTIVLEIPHKIETGITQAIEIDNTQIIDHETTLIIVLDQF